METEPKDLVLELLRSIRAEITDIRSEMKETNAKIGVLAEGLNSVRNEIREARTDVKNIQQDLARMDGHIQEIAMAVDHHTTRLDLIEKHLGLGVAQH